MLLVPCLYPLPVSISGNTHWISRCQNLNCFACELFLAPQTLLCHEAKSAWELTQPHLAQHSPMTDTSQCINIMYQFLCPLGQINLEYGFYMTSRVDPVGLRLIARVAASLIKRPSLAAFPLHCHMPVTYLHLLNGLFALESLFDAC